MMFFVSVCVCKTGEGGEKVRVWPTDCQFNFYCVVK